MSSEVICLIITTVGSLAAAAISAATSKKVAASEIKKLKLTWEREDAITSSEDIAELTRLVYSFTSCLNDAFAIPAISKTAEIRTNATGEFAAALDELYDALSQRNRIKAESLMSEVIKSKSLVSAIPAHKQKKHKG